MVRTLILAFAAEAGLATMQHWTPISTTAPAITGKVTLTASMMWFQNGRSLTLQRVADGVIAESATEPHGSARTYHLYRIVSLVNPSLVRGNLICPQTPRFLLLAYAPSDAAPHAMVFARYYGGTAPPPNWDNPSHLCATFTYERTR
jgi:hypothetical protein